MIENIDGSHLQYGNLPLSPDTKNQRSLSYVLGYLRKIVNIKAKTKQIAQKDFWIEYNSVLGIHHWNSCLELHKKRIQCNKTWRNFGPPL